MQGLDVFEGEGGAEVLVRRGDEGRFRERFPKASRLFGYEMDGRRTMVREGDVDAFEGRYAGKAQRLYGVVQDDGRPVFVREGDREAFLRRGRKPDEPVKEEKAMRMRGPRRYEESPGVVDYAGAALSGFGEGAVRGARDTAANVATGVAVRLPKTVIGAADVASWPIQAALTPLSTGRSQTGMVGKTVDEAVNLLAPGLNRVGERIDAMHSDEYRARRDRVNEAKGILGTARELVRAPEVVVGTTLESVPSMLLGGKVGKILARVAPAVAGVAGSLGEGVSAAGAVHEAIREQSPGGVTTAKQSALAMAAGVWTATVGAISNKLAGRMNLADPEAIAAGVQGARRVAGTKAGRALQAGGAAILEGVEEFAQEPGEGLAENLALGRPALEGLANQATQGAAGGFVMGVAAGVDVRGGARARADAAMEAAADRARRSAAWDAAMEAAAARADAADAAGAEAAVDAEAGAGADAEVGGQDVKGAEVPGEPTGTSAFPGGERTGTAVNTAALAPPVSDANTAALAPPVRDANMEVVPGARLLLGGREVEVVSVDGDGGEAVVVGAMGDESVVRMERLMEAMRETAALAPPISDANTAALAPPVGDAKVEAGIEAPGEPTRTSAIPGEPTRTSAIPGDDVVGRREVTAPEVAERIVVEKTAEGDTVVSAPEADRARVPPAEQRRYLMAQVDEAIAAAPEMERQDAIDFSDLRQGFDESTRRWKNDAPVWLIEKQIRVGNALGERYGYVTVVVPGDGVFKVLNVRGHLSDLKAAAGKMFPDKPTKVSYPKVEVRARSSVRVAARKASYGVADAGRLLKVFVGKDKTRTDLDRSYVIGEAAVASDGARMAAVRVPEGTKGSTEMKGRAVGFRQVLESAAPGWLEGRSVRVEGRSVEVKQVETLARKLNQAAAAVVGDVNQSVALYEMADGTLEVASGGLVPGRAVEADGYSSLRDGQAGTLLGMYDAGFLVDALGLMRATGNGSARFAVKGKLEPLVVYAENAAVVLMPMNGAVAAEQVAGTMTDGEVQGERVPAAPAEGQGVPTRTSAIPGEQVQAAPAEGQAGQAAGETAAGEQRREGDRRGGAVQGAQGGKLNGRPRIGLGLADVVELAKALGGGRAPKVMRELSTRWAAGLFRFVAGDLSKAGIEVRADQALVVGEGERVAIRAAAEAQVLQELGPRSVENGVEWDLRMRWVMESEMQAAFLRNLEADPEQAMKVLAHEVGHWVDAVPEGSLKRGNIFGHIAAVKRYLGRSMGMGPDEPGPITPAERREMMRQARKEVGQGRERIIFEEVVREVPVFRELGLKAEDVVGLMGVEAGAMTPELYEWFARQPTAVKKDVLKAAMRGVVDARAAEAAGTVQVGTRLERKTVERRFKPTEADVRARFKEMLREEAARRRLADLAVVKEELRGLLAWYNNAEVMPVYYEPAAEMFADSFSAWLNYPAEVAARAPIFNELMEGWLTARPEVYAHYSEMLRRMESPEVDMNRRVAEFERGMVEVSRKAQEAAMNRSPLSRGEFWDKVAGFFLRTREPIYWRMRKLKDAGMRDTVEAANADQRYWGADAERLVGGWRDRVEGGLMRAGVPAERFDVYLTMRRIAYEGVETMVDAEHRRGRANLFNPFGFTPKTARAWLAAHERTAPESFAALKAAGDEMVALRNEVVFPVLRQTGALDPKTYDLIVNNWAYARFKIDAHEKVRTALEEMIRSGEAGGSGVRHQVGTLRQIGGPARNTLLADVAMMRWAMTQYANRLNVQTVMEVTPEDVQELRADWVNGRPIWKEVNTSRAKTVHVMEAGVDHAYVVPTAVARAMGLKGDEGVLSTMAARFVSLQARFLTTLNLGFSLRNPGRDFQRAAKLLPGWLYLPVVGNPVLLWKVFAALPASLRRAKGLTDPAVDEALRRHMLVPGQGSYSESAWYGAEDDVSRAARGAGLRTRAAVAGKALSAGKAALNFWGKVNGLLQVSETAVKLGAMKYLDARYPDMPEVVKQRMVQKLAGTPDVLERSTLGSNSAARMAVLFYNVNKEAVLGQVEAARDRPIEQAYKTVIGAIPAIVTTMAAYNVFSEMLRQFAAAVGDGGGDDEDDQEAAWGLRVWADQVADWERMQQSIPFRDRMLYNSVAFGWDDKDQRKAAYIRFMDDQLNGATRVATLGMLEAMDGRVSVSEALDLGFADFTPNISPFVAVGIGMLSGKDPAFGWHSILADEDAVHSAAGRKDVMRQYAKWIWNNMSGGTLGMYRLQPDRSPYDPEPGTMERWLKAPGVSLASSFVRVSNAGVRQQFRLEDSRYKGWQYDNRKLVDRLIAMQSAGEAIPPEMVTRIQEVDPSTLKQMYSTRIKERSLRAAPLDWQRLYKVRNRPFEFQE